MLFIYFQNLHGFFLLEVWISEFKTLKNIINNCFTLKLLEFNTYGMLGVVSLYVI